MKIWKSVIFRAPLVAIQMISGKTGGGPHSCFGTVRVCKEMSLGLLWNGFCDEWQWIFSRFSQKKQQFRLQNYFFSEFFLGWDHKINCFFASINNHPLLKRNVVTFCCRHWEKSSNWKIYIHAKVHCQIVVLLTIPKKSVDLETVWKWK